MNSRAWRFYEVPRSEAERQERSRVALDEANRAGDPDRPVGLIEDLEATWASWHRSKEEVRRLSEYEEGLKRDVDSIKVLLESDQRLSRLESQVQRLEAERKARSPQKKEMAHGR